ncbi:MAG: PQQ-binding-like beta-propeller repeat protein [Ktedonobacterales bacterium]
MVKRWFVAVIVTLTGVLILLLWLFAAPALWDYLHPTFPPTVVCQPADGSSVSGNQSGQPVVVAVVHASRYRERASIRFGATIPLGPQTTILCLLRPSDGSLVRRLDIGHGDYQFTRIVQVGDTWYLGGTNGSGLGTLCALDAQNGATRWCYANPASQSGEDAFASAISPDGRLVYIRTADAVYGLDAASGQQRWRIAFGRPTSVNAVLAVTSTAVATVGVTISASGVNPAQASMVGLSPSSGAVLWRRPLVIANPGYMQLVSDGAAFYVDGVSMQSAELSGRLYAVRASDGAVLWQTALHCAPARFSLTVDAGRVYYDDGGCTTDPAPIPWTFFAARASDGAVAWSLHGNPVDTGPLTASNGIVYITGAFGADTSVMTTTFSARRATDGALLWTTPLVHTGGGLVQGAFVVGGVVCQPEYGMGIDGYGVSDGALRWRACAPAFLPFSVSVGATKAPIIRPLWPTPFARLTATGAGSA